MSEIVAEPADATALPGVSELLVRLASRLAVVAVVSGRPVAFLEDALSDRSGALELYGLYGLERLGSSDGEQGPRSVAEVTVWVPVVRAAVADVGDLPDGAEMEDKGVSFVLHWRRAPGHGPELESRGRQIAATHGLVARAGRRSLEVLPPVSIDKGTIVRDRSEGQRCAGFLGDDRGDLAAFRALDDLHTAGARVVRIAVASPEAPAPLLDAADLVVDGPRGAVAFLESLAARLGT